jgi:hypothetical protein
MPRSIATRRWFPTTQPQTLQIAAALLYWNAALAVLASLVGLHVGVVTLAAILLDVLGAYGIANQRKAGYVVALVAALVPLVALLGALFLGGAYLAGSLLTLIFDIALVALLLHPVSLGYMRIWFR